MSEQEKRKVILMNLSLGGLFALGVYLLFAWASYSELDNAWTVASSLNQGVLNKTGEFGAWTMDILFALFGKLAGLIAPILCLMTGYALVFRSAARLTFAEIGWRMFSVLLFLVGLASLANGLFSDAGNYPSGGVVGALLVGGLSAYIGQIGALLVATILVSVGFYFCSGQTLFELGTMLYEWITAPDEEETKTEAASEAVSSEPANDHVETALNPVHLNEEKPEKIANPTPMADVHRPNIIGLRKENPPADLAKGDFTHPSQFIRPAAEAEPASEPKTALGFEAQTPAFPKIRLEPHLPDMPKPAEALPDNALQATLPKVSLQPMIPNAEPVAVNTEIQAEALPTVESAESLAAKIRFPHLNDKPVASNVEPILTREEPREEPKPMQDKMNQDEMNEEEILWQAELAKQFARAEQAKLDEIRLRAEAQGAAHLFAEPDAETGEEEAPKTAPFSPLAEVTKTAEKKPLNNYVVHPLLQRDVSSIKPTTPLPSLKLLNTHPESQPQMTEEEALETSRKIEQTLADYGIRVKVEDVLIGPVVTRYEVRPEVGVKASKVMDAAEDLSRELMIKVRITSKVPGKPYMGIELPNSQRETVWLGDVLNSPEFEMTDAVLPMALGTDISGKPVIIDLADTPHLLVAGTTGTGKSVGVNGMLLSLLLKRTPEELRFIMIDPKAVELSIYDEIPHLLTPVVTDMKKSKNALQWVVDEMERRYAWARYVKVRKIQEYNEKIAEAEAIGIPFKDPLWKPSDSMDSEAPELKKLSYIVVVIDEYADLVMTEGKEVEQHVARIAQKARAMGIHLIVATQRPSADIITGMIKNNLPSRVAYTMSSGIDSRTVLGTTGAESLLGRGDLLYQQVGKPEMVRVQGAFMTEDEISRVVAEWHARGKPHYIDGIVGTTEEESLGEEQSGEGFDPLFDEVVAFVQETGITSSSRVQRHFRVGFNRAARIMDELEEAGILVKNPRTKQRELA